MATVSTVAVNVPNPTEEYVKVILVQADCMECSADEISFAKPNQYQLQRGLESWEHGIEILADRLDRWEEIEAEYRELQVELGEIIAEGRMAQRAKMEADERARRRSQEIREANIIRPWRS